MNVPLAEQIVTPMLHVSTPLDRSHALVILDTLVAEHLVLVSVDLITVCKLFTMLSYFASAYNLNDYNLINILKTN